jgi:hypothetical protein
MDQNLIGQVKETIIYLIVFTASICILLHFYIFPSIKKAVLSDDSSVGFKEIEKDNEKTQKPTKRNNDKDKG